MTNGIVGSVALILYAACWALPIADNKIGYDGATFAHQEFWNLITLGKTINSPGELLGAIFIGIGWMANELFVIGVAAYWYWPYIAVRTFAFALGIMISWQVAFLEEFPLLIGYWAWVAAGAMMVWLAAKRLARLKRQRLGTILTERLTVVLFALPLIIAAIGVALSKSQ